MLNRILVLYSFITLILIATALQTLAVPLEQIDKLDINKSNVEYYYRRYTLEGEYLVLVLKDATVKYIDCNNDCTGTYIKTSKKFGWEKGYR